MANTSTPANLKAIKFDKELIREYVRGNGFNGFMGKSGSRMPIVTKEEKGAVDIRIPFSDRLSGAGVSGNESLRGNGEAIGFESDTLTTTYWRNSVEFSKEEADKPSFDMRSEARPMLMNWGMELMRDQIIRSFSAVSDGTTYANIAEGDSQYPTVASEALKDSWLTNNSDRILFGAAKGNTVSGDHSASLANIDSTNDTLSKSIVGIAKRMAQGTSPKIRPFKVKDTVYESYVMFVGSNAYRDFYNSSEVQGDLQNARERAKGNPLFMPGDLMFDNVIIREIPEITTELTESSAFSSAGNSSIAVEPCFLVGAEAIGYGLAQRPTSREDNTYDYGFQPGVAVEMKHQFKKLFRGNKQNGVVTVYVSGVADA